MSESNELNSGRDELERALRTVAPVHAAIDPIAAAFDAGRRQQHRAVRVWQSAAVVMLFAGVATGWIPRASPAPGPSVTLPPTWVKLATRPSQETDSTVHPVSNQSLLMLQRAVREKGIDGLPEAATPPLRVMHVDDSI